MTLNVKCSQVVVIPALVEPAPITRTLPLGALRFVFFILFFSFLFFSFLFFILFFILFFSSLYSYLYSFLYPFLFFILYFILSGPAGVRVSASASSATSLVAMPTPCTRTPAALLTSGMLAYGESETDQLVHFIFDAPTNP